MIVPCLFAVRPFAAHRFVPKHICLSTTLIVVSLILLLPGCGPKRETVHRAFYEWRSSVSYSPDDLATFSSLRINRLYLRLFDVQWHEHGNTPYPESIVQCKSPLPPNVEIVPTIYVTNDVMKRVNEDQDLDELADRIATKIEEMMKEAGQETFSEVQMDCDWTASSRTSYFKFLRKISEQFPDKTLSATIRLHQIKYRVETGIPPVDRGMLMAYNVGSVTAVDETNSIFTASEVEKYIGNLHEYPLPLDAALPLFSWGVRFHFNRFAAIIDNVDLKELRNNPAFKETDENHFQAIQSTTLRGEPVYAGDVIRLEEPSRDGVLSIAQKISSDRGEPEIAVALYRFDPTIIKRYHSKYLNDLYHAFE